MAQGFELMSGKTIGILDAFKKLNFGKRDVLVLKSQSLDSTDVMRMFAALKSKFGFDGFIIVLKENETIEAMNESTQREVYKELHERFGKKD